MKGRKIADKDISLDNYATFKKCEIIGNGKIIKFTMTCGVSYDVPLEYFLRWFSYPHYLFANGKLTVWKNPMNQNNRTDSEVTAVKCRHVLSETAVRVYLSSGAVYDVPWDTVLMACEPEYEHFGGLTDESRKIVYEWSGKNSDKIRTEPDDKDNKDS